MIAAAVGFGGEGGGRKDSVAVLVVNEVVIAVDRVDRVVVL